MGKKNLPANAGDAGLIPGSVKILWSRKWQLTPVFLPRKSHGQMGLSGYSPWGHKELDMTKQLTTWAHTHTRTHTQRIITQETVF